jgi:hypothetical protein
MDNEFVDDEPFSVIQYVKENFIGLLLLLLAFFIIYFVDHISRINAMIFAMPSPIPGVPADINNIIMHKPKKTKNFKK